MAIIDRLIDRIEELDCSIILGLDSRPDYIPKCVIEKYGSNIIGISQAILQYNKSIIDATSDILPAVKIQMGYFQMMGIYGIDIYNIICDYAKEKGMLVIGDAKIGDVSSVSKAYSNAYLGRVTIGSDLEPIFNADFVTINPYFGSDTIRPFIADCKMYDKGIFVVVKTGNKSAYEVQNIVDNNGIKVYENVAKLVNEWGEELKGNYGYSSIGAVVVADNPEEYENLRKLMPNTYIMVSGYSEKKETEKLVTPTYNEEGKGLIISVAKNIATAYKSENWKGIYTEEEFASAAKAEAVRIKNKVNSYRRVIQGGV